MACKIITFILLLLPFKLHCSNTQSWIKAGYWYSGSELPVADINSALFSHLLCAFSFLNSSTYQLSINSSKVESFSTFTNIVKRKNRSITTLLSIWVGRNDFYTFTSMMNQSSSRKSFIDSTIRTARRYGFHGLDLSGVLPSTRADMTNLGTLLDELREAVTSESRNSSKSQLLLVMSGRHSPALDSVTYPIDAMKRNLDWVHIFAYDYHLPTKENLTGPHAALYYPLSGSNTDYGITGWINRGLSASKLVLGLPYHGYAWTLVNPNNNAMGGAPALGPAITADGSIGYKLIKMLLKNYGYGAVLEYNDTYVVNYCTIGSNWINFDGVEAVKAKIAYAKAKGLAGYNVFQLSNDDNWELSRAAHETEEDRRNKWRLLVGIPLAAAIVIILLGSMMFYLRRRVFKSKGTMDMVKRSLSKLKIKLSADEGLNSNAPNLQMFSYSKTKAATNNFSSKNKIGEGGFGPVYKGKLPKGQEIAVKRLSKTSTQGLEEFKNEVTLTAKLQHVNLLRVLGFCIEREEKMLIYEHMPNKSLDFYLFGM